MTSGCHGRSRWSAPAWPLALLAVAAGPAAAEPGHDVRGTEAVFTGPTSAHPSSIARFPAALPLGQPGNHLYLSGSVALDHTTVDRATIDVDTGALGPGPTVAATTLSPGGSLSYWTAAARVAFGVTVSTTPADATADDARADAPLRYSSTGERFRESHLLAFGLAAGITERIFAGASFSMTRTDVTLGFARDTALAAGRDASRGLASDCGGAPCGLENPAATELYAIDVAPSSLLASDNFVVSVGALVEVWPRWWVALSYRTSPWLGDELTLTGTATVTLAPRDGGDTVTGDASVRVRVPSTLDAGVRGPIAPGLEFVSGARWTDLSRHDGLDVRLYGRDLIDAGLPERLRRPYGYRDTLDVHAGVEQVDVGQRLLGGARLSVTTPAIDADRTTVTTVDGWSLGASVGGQLRLSPALRLQGTYVGRYWPTVDASASAYNPLDQLDCIDSGYDASTTACAAVRDGYARPTAAGTCGRTEHSLLLAVRYDW
ncbi:MAG: hypothetical protein R2939_12535 [Kofleriaceae bacterium]